MYQPRPHRVDDRARCLAFIRERPLGLLVTAGAGLAANPLPFSLDEQPGGGTFLRAHMARDNPQWRDAPCDAIAVFLDPGSYVTPTWYATKKTTREVVPTWNYVCVQARGALRAVEDRAWLRTQIDALTAEQEKGAAEPWRPSDAPADFIERMMDAIVGVELRVDSLEGKWKASQTRVAEDRAGVVAGLRARGGEASLEMADIVEREGVARGANNVA